jgi:hypothetical protein
MIKFIFIEFKAALAEAITGQALRQQAPPGVTGNGELWPPAL